MREVLDQILLSDDVLNGFYSNYENGEFRVWVHEILPEIEDCARLKQDNPWHIYNCLDHILHSVQEINKESQGMKENERRMLAYVMFLHDIGKPACHIRRYSKLYKREVDSFFDHNKKSEEIAKRVLPKLSFDGDECEIMSLLILEHDIFMFITLEEDGNPYHKVLSNKLINEKIAEYNKVGNGRQILEYLVKVGRADNKAQNPKMTKNSLLLLDKFDSMLENQNENV